MERNPVNPPRVIPVRGDLALFPVVTQDAEEIYVQVDRNRQRLREWLPWLSDGYSLTEAKEFATRCQRDNADRVSLTTCIRLEGRICGAIGLHRIDRLHRNTSIGYWLAEEYQGRGIMTAACAALVTHAFHEYGLHRVEIRCATGNDRSRAIPLRLGFTEEGVLHEVEWLYDHWVDLRVFAMLERNWRAVDPAGIS